MWLMHEIISRGKNIIGASPNLASLIFLTNHHKFHIYTLNGFCRKDVTVSRPNC